MVTAKPRRQDMYARLVAGVYLTRQSWLSCRKQQDDDVLNGYSGWIKHFISWLG